MNIELNCVRLYLPDAVMKERLESAAPLAAYIDAVMKETRAFWETVEEPAAAGVLIVVGIKPGGAGKIWCEAVGGEISTDVLADLETHLGALPTIAVVRAPIAFAVEVRLHGSDPADFPHLPKVWTDAVALAKKRVVVPDELFPLIWPD